MKTTTAYRLVIAIILFYFWLNASQRLTENPEPTIQMIPIALGTLTGLAIIIELVLRKGMQEKMKKILNSEIEARREELVEDLKKLVSYLEKTKYPSYSKSGVEGLEDDFRKFDSIKSKYTFEPKIIKSTILIILSSLVLALFWLNPTLWIYVSDETTFTLAHLGIGLFTIGLWMIVDMFITSLEIKPWEKETE